MNILGIDTATKILGIGLANEHGLIAEYRINQGYKHAELIADATKQLLADAGLNINALDGIAVSIGPGSFTGLRVGVAYVKGLALATDLPVVAVPTMEAMVQCLPPLCETAYVLLTARKGEVYRGQYVWRDGWHSQSDHIAVVNSEVAESIPEMPCLFIGEGVKPCLEILRQYSQVRFVPECFNFPGGYAVAAVGHKMLEAGQISEIASLDPNYLKPFKGIA